MALAMDCPERLLRVRVRSLLIGDTGMWEDISIERLSQGQYHIIGHGTDKKVGSGTMTQENALNVVVGEVLALHQAHLEEEKRLKELAAILAEWLANRKPKKVSIPAAQLPLWNWTETEMQQTA